MKKYSAFIHNLRTTTASFGVKAGGAVLSVTMIASIASRMTASEFGIFGTAVSIATFLSAAGEGGQRGVLLRFMPVYLALKNSEVAWALVRFSALVCLVFSVLVGVIGGAFVHFLNLFSDNSIVLAILLLTFSGTLAEWLSALFRSSGSLLFAMGPKEVAWRIVVTALVLVYPSSRLSAEVAIVMMALLQFAVSAIQGFVGLRLLGRTTSSYCSHEANNSGTSDSLLIKEERIRWTQAFWGNWGVHTAHAFFPNASVAVASSLLPASDVGVFFLANKIATAVGLPMNSLNIAFSPKVTKLLHFNDLKQLESIARSIALQATCLSALGAICVSCLPYFDFILPQLDIGSSMFIINTACIGVLISSSFGPTAFTMQLAGRERLFLFYLSASSLISLAIFAWLATQFGTREAATTALVTPLLVNVPVWIWFRRNLRIEPSLLGILPFFRMQS